MDQHDEISNKSNDSQILSNDSHKSNKSSKSKDTNETKRSNKTSDNETKMKLEKYKKLQESMENDDLSSQEITIGSSAKGGTITVKTSKNVNKTIIDDLSLCTTDDNESGVRKMKSIAKYTKIELEELAKTHGVQVPSKSNKTMIYNALKQIIDAK